MKLQEIIVSNPDVEYYDNGAECLHQDELFDFNYDNDQEYSTDVTTDNRLLIKKLDDNGYMSSIADYKECNRKHDDNGCHID